MHAVATNKKGEYLILQRAPHRSSPRSWNVVTGYIQEREPAEDAALRELKEETNLGGKIIKTTEPFWHDDGEKRFVIITSLIKINNPNDLVIDLQESSSHRWIKSDDPIVQSSPGMKLSFEKLGILP